MEFITELMESFASLNEWWSAFLGFLVDRCGSFLATIVIALITAFFSYRSGRSALDKLRSMEANAYLILEENGILKKRMILDSAVGEFLPKSKKARSLIRAVSKRQESKKQFFFHFFKQEWEQIGNLLTRRFEPMFKRIFFAASQFQEGSTLPMKSYVYSLGFHTDKCLDSCELGLFAIESSLRERLLSAKNIDSEEALFTGADDELREILDHLLSGERQENSTNSLATSLGKFELPSTSI